MATPLFTFDDEIERPAIPSADKPISPTVGDRLLPEPSFEEAQQMTESLPGKFFAGLPSAAMGVATFPADVVRTIGGIPSAYDEIRNDPTRTEAPPNKLTAALASPLISALNTFTRGVPEEERNAAKGRVIASTVGGLGGGSAGAIAGAPFGPPGMIAGGAIGSILGGVGGDRYARETYQEKKLVPEENQWEEDKQDMANLGLSALMARLTNTTKKIAGNKAGGSYNTAQRRLEEIERATNPASLQAQALINSPKDAVIRKPRTGEPDYIPLGKEIDVTSQGNSVAIAPENDSIIQIEQGLIDYENSLSPSSALPVVDVPTTNLPSKIKIEGDTTSGTPVIDVEAAQPIVDESGGLPFKKDRDPNQYYLDQALNEPGIQEAMEYVRTGKGSEFDTLIPKVLEKQVEAKNSNIGIMNKVPVEKYPTAGNVLFKSFDEKLKKANVPQAEKKAYYDVFYDELSGLMPRILGWQDGDLRNEEFRMLLNKKRNSEKGGSRQINDLAGGIVSKLSPDETAKLNNYFKELAEAPMSPVLIDELKTKFADLGGYDKPGSGGLGVDTDSNRAKAYKLISDNLRNTVESVVYQTIPDEFSAFRDNNRRSQIFNTVEKMAKKRAAEERQFGRGRVLEQFKTDIGANRYFANPFPYIGKAVKDFFIPQPTTREGMLRQADKDPFNRGTGYTMFKAPVIAQGAYQASAGLSKAVEGYQKGTTTRLQESVGKKIPARPGIEPYIGNAATLADPAILSNQEVEEVENTSQGWLEQLGNAVNKINPFVTKEAGAQELTMADKLPRKTELMTSENMAKFLQGTVATPEKAVIGQSLVKKMVEASNVGDMDKVEKIHADMVKLFPEQFESGFGVNGKAFHPDDQAKIMDNLKKLHREGLVDNIQLAKQRNAFADPMDARILEVKPLVQSKKQPSDYDKTISTFINEDNTKFSPEDSMKILHWLTLGHKAPEAQPPPRGTPSFTQESLINNGQRKYSY
jgi:hypothetical protein